MTKFNGVGSLPRIMRVTALTKKTIIKQHFQDPIGITWCRLSTHDHERQEATRDNISTMQWLNSMASALYPGSCTYTSDSQKYNISRTPVGITWRRLSTHDHERQEATRDNISTMQWPNSMALALYPGSCSYTVQAPARNNISRTPVSIKWRRLSTQDHAHMQAPERK
jgi:hypothetical protein